MSEFLEDVPLTGDPFAECREAIRVVERAGYSIRANRGYIVAGAKGRWRITDLGRSLLIVLA